jgi:hypothetical protein
MGHMPWSRRGVVCPSRPAPGAVFVLGALLAACSASTVPEDSPRETAIDPETGDDAGDSTGEPTVPDSGAPGVSADAGGSNLPTPTDAGDHPQNDGGKLPDEPSRPEGLVPNAPYPAELIDLPLDRWADGIISPTLESEHHNQPTIINGYLQLTGNARFSMYDIHDPTAPEQLSVSVSPDDCLTCGPAGEAEGHQVGFARYGNTLYTATISGKGIDIWDITNARAPRHVEAVHLEGIDYGDFTDAVWGLAWQGTTIYVGGTNTGLHVLDARDPEHVQVVKRLPTSAFGGVSAGPVYAIGNVLVLTTPKESGGIATFDISNPRDPFVLDSVSMSKSYIGAFYAHHVYLQNPLRAWDVLSDPTTIGSAEHPVGRLDTPASEYMSFGDGIMFLGLVRPNPGALKIDVSDPGSMRKLNRVWGRMNLIGADDQFTVAVGNLLVLSDDQLVGSTYVGTVIAVHAKDPDTTAPRVDTIIPRDGAVDQALSSRIGISFTDTIELATVDANSLIVRPVGGEPIAGTFSSYMTVLNFEPAQPLAPDTTYEVVIPTGRLTDYVGNGLSEEFRSTFTTR